MESISHPQGYYKYIHKTLELNPNNKDTITSIELWGGEPLLGLEDFMIYLSDFFREFPNINTIQLSTNFTLDNSATLINELSQSLYSINPSAKIKLQISIDGPEWLNDFNRGIGSTQAVLNNISFLNNQYENIEMVTNSVLYTKGLYGLLSYEQMEEWFDFFIDNFPEECKHGLFRFAKVDGQYTDEDGARAAQLLAWADQWRTQNSTAAQKFIWPDYQKNILKICSAADPNGLLALSPNCNQAICHQAIIENQFGIDVPALNLTTVEDLIMDYYPRYKDKISLDDFKESLIIYINLMWCPLRISQPRDFVGDGSWFFNGIPLYYNGAMNTLLKWSRTYGHS